MLQLRTSLYPDGLTTINVLMDCTQQQRNATALRFPDFLFIVVK
jgi:hypothetical protein